MAIIKCPECGKDVSNKAKTCPNCGFAVSHATNDLIRIKVDRDPSFGWTTVCIYTKSGNKLLATVKAGGVAEFRSTEDVAIVFRKEGSYWPMFETTVSPKNGGKYRAVWGAGIINATITSCFAVDEIDF